VSQFSSQCRVLNGMHPFLQRFPLKR
jgi:hypothetical protein